MPNISDYKELMSKIKLTPVERHVCDLKYLDDKTFMEIGESIGISESGAIKAHKRALEKIARSKQNI